MRIGATFPQTEIGSDPLAVRDWAQAVEELGYDHILSFEHVLGASITNRPGWNGPYTSESLFHEIFVLFGYLAAVTQRVGLVANVLVLPQRQTALVAKQAAEVDVLSGGRLRLGVGVGWNAVEYEALNEDFRTRGARCDEQIAVLRAHWSEPVISFQGRWHHIDEAGIKPLPVQRPIPIWIGGSADPVLRRAARLGDGWFPQREPPGHQMRDMIGRLHQYAREAGRAPEALSIQGRLKIGETPESDWHSVAAAWQDLGATHLSVTTMDANLASPQAHIDVFACVLDRLKTESGLTE